MPIIGIRSARTRGASVDDSWILAALRSRSSHAVMLLPPASLGSVGCFQRRPGATAIEVRDSEPAATMEGASVRNFPIENQESTDKASCRLRRSLSPSRDALR